MREREQVLNKSYKSVWNTSSGTFVAAVETTRGRGKKSSRMTRSVAILAALAAVFSTKAFANPDGLDAATAGQVWDILNAQSVSTAHEVAAPQTEVTEQGNSVKSMPPGVTQILGDTPSVTSYISVSQNVIQGTRTEASNDFNAMAIGPAAMATAAEALAVGSGAGAGSIASTAVGSGAAALSVNSTVIGSAATTGSNAPNSVAIGYHADAEGANTMAFGTSSMAAADSSISFGYNAYTSSSAANSIAVGTNALTNASDGVALGANTLVNASGSVALGTGSLADRANAVSVGTSAQQRQIVNVAAGTQNTDAVNVSQLTGVTTAIGGGASVNPNGTVQQPSFSVNGHTYADIASALAAAGSASNDAVQYDSSSHHSVTLGGGATAPVLLTNVAAGAQSTDAVNVGQLKSLGANLDTSGNVLNSFSAYDDATQDAITLKGASGTKITGLAPASLGAGSTDAINGSQMYAHATSTAVALGGGSTVNADGAVTAPSYSVGGTVVNTVGGAISNLDGRVTQNASDIANLQTTVGSISGTVANAVQYDSSAHNSVTLGGSSSAPAVKLTNLQAGTLSATRTDAVTGAQLWATNQQVSGLTQAVQNVQTTGNTGIATNTGGVPAAATGTSSVAIGGGATASGANSVAIGQGSLADQPSAVSMGSAGNERRITNVADGVVPTDAVNMRRFESGMSDIARNAYSGTASAIALTMIPDVDANKNLAIGVGTSGYKGYQAVAVGLSARVTQSLKVKLGAGISSATTTVGAGAAYQW